MTSRTIPDLTWPAAPADTSLGPNEVHVWAAPLDLTPPQLSLMAQSLSASELERASRFHFSLHRDRFIAGRGLSRALLSRYLNAKPAALEFACEPAGKPSISGTFATSGLHFNLSHSESLALLAISCAAALGVDIERTRPIAEMDQLVSRFFSARENSEFQKLPAEQKPGAFFNLWTRKEAWLKGTGQGIGHLLDQVEVSFLPGQTAQLLSLPVQHRRDESWKLFDLRPAADFVAALAVAANPARLQCWRWEP